MNNTYSFPIETVSILAEGKIIPKKMAVIRSDTKDALGIVSDRYKLVSHSEVIDTVRKIVPSSATEKIHVERNGAMLLAEYLLDKKTEVAKGDFLQTRLLVRNSYDGSATFSMTLGAYRLVCTNGMVIGQDYSTYSKKHSGNLDVEAVSKGFETLLSGFDENLGFLKQMTLEQYIPTLEQNWNSDKQPLRKIFSKKQLELVRDEYNTSSMKSLWGLYNACTSVITHKSPKLAEYKKFVLLKSLWKTMPSLTN